MARSGTPDRYIRPFTQTKPGEYASRMRKLLRDFRPLVTIAGVEPPDGDDQWQADFGAMQHQMMEVRRELTSFAYSEVDAMGESESAGEGFQGIEYAPPPTIDLWTNPPQWPSFDSVMNIFGHYREALHLQLQHHEALVPRRDMARFLAGRTRLTEGYTTAIIPFAVYFGKQLDRLGSAFPAHAANVAEIRAIVGDPIRVPDLKHWDEFERGIRRGIDLIKAVWRDAGQPIPNGVMIPFDDPAEGTIHVHGKHWDWQWEGEPREMEKRRRGNGPTLEPNLITAAVAADRYWVSRKTLRDHVKKGQLTDHRRPDAARNSPLYLDEKEVAQRWNKRGR